MLAGNYALDPRRSLGASAESRLTEIEYRASLVSYLGVTPLRPFEDEIREREQRSGKVLLVYWHAEFLCVPRRISRKEVTNCSVHQSEFLSRANARRSVLYLFNGLGEIFFFARTISRTAAAF